MRVVAAVAVVAVMVTGVVYGYRRQSSDPSCTPVHQSRADRFCVPDKGDGSHLSWDDPASLAPAVAGVAIAVGVIAYRRFTASS
jgi:hypothetical protein